MFLEEYEGVPFKVNHSLTFRSLPETFSQTSGEAQLAFEIKATLKLTEQLCGMWHTLHMQIRFLGKESLNQIFKNPRYLRTLFPTFPVLLVDFLQPKEHNFEQLKIEQSSR